MRRVGVCRLRRTAMPLRPRNRNCWPSIVPFANDGAQPHTVCAPDPLCCDRRSGSRVHRVALAVISLHGSSPFMTHLHLPLLALPPLPYPRRLWDGAVALHPVARYAELAAATGLSRGEVHDGVRRLRVGAAARADARQVHRAGNERLKLLRQFSDPHRLGSWQVAI